MSHHILLLGGHGKIAQLLTPILLSRSWNVTSLIRSPEQVETISKLGQGQPGKLNIVVSSLEKIKSEGDAKQILEEVNPDWVVFSAGAGGKGGPSATMAIDHDSAIAFTKASIHTPSIKKFLTVSYCCSRRSRPSWWSDEDWAAAQKVNNEVLPTYFKAKVAADEVLTVLSKERVEKETKEGVSEKERFCGISLRPGTLKDNPAGNVKMGRIEARGDVSRESVAEVIAEVLATQGLRGWLDLLDGDDKISDAVGKVAKEGISAEEGEDFEGMKERVSKL